MSRNDVSLADFDLNGKAFDAETLQTLVLALDTACRTLDRWDGETRKRLAQQVVASAREGERDPRKLAFLALESLNPTTQ